MACNDCGVDDKASADPIFRRVLWAALIANLAMFFIEIVAAQLGDSLSLQADALDFFSDAANYGISLFVAGMALAARARAAIFKGVSMAAFGLWVLGSALHRSLTGSEPDPAMMGSIAVLALAVNITVALMLYRYRRGDSNMQSIWLCSRNDAIGNVAVMIAAAGVLATASRWPDLLVAVIIAGLAISSAIQVLRLATVELRSSPQTANGAL